MFPPSHFDALIASRSLLKHPFYQLWNRGELTLEDLRIYAQEYFHLVQAIPGLVSRIRDRAVESRPDMLELIEENGREETEHIDLWKRFALSLSITEEELLTYTPSAEVQHAVQALETACDGTFQEAVGAMYALEKELPEIAQTKKEGLSKFYNLHSEDAHIYFDEHLKEAKHLGVWLNVQMDEQAEEAVQRSLDAQNAILDGVCSACDISLPCACCSA